MNESSVQHVIESQEGAIRFQLNVPSFSPRDIANALICHPDIKKIINNALSPEYNLLGQKAVGFFLDPTTISNEMYLNAGEIIKKHYYSKKIRLLYKSNGHVFHSEKHLFEYLEIILENRRTSEQCDIDTAKMIVHLIINYLKRGNWHYGIIKRKDCKEKDYSLVPSIWFGKPNEQPIDIWTLNELDNHFAEDIGSVNICNAKPRSERWKAFWFGKIESFDWNALLNNKGSEKIASHITDIIRTTDFAALFENIRNNCPILLEEDDLPETLDTKIQLFFDLIEYTERDNSGCGKCFIPQTDIHFPARMNHKQYKEYFRSEIFESAKSFGYSVAEGNVLYSLMHLPLKTKNKKEVRDYISENLIDPDQLYEYLNGEDFGLIEEIADDDEVGEALYGGAYQYATEYVKNKIKYISFNKIIEIRVKAFIAEYFSLEDEFIENINIEMNLSLKRDDMKKLFSELEEEFMISISNDLLQDECSVVELIKFIQRKMKRLF